MQPQTRSGIGPRTWPRKSDRKIARVQFTTGQASDITVGELQKDDWYANYDFRFPSSWSEELSLPVAVTDTGGGVPPSGGWNLACNTEIVSAFWKTVNRIVKMLAQEVEEFKKAKLRVRRSGMSLPSYIL